MNLAGHTTTTPSDASRRPGISVVVPVYRSEAILSDLVQRLSQTLPSLAEQYELILVNDCSPDNSWNIIGRLQRQYAWICGINLMRNYGQHNALLCGIRAARYDVIVTMDDDLQHPPEEIPKLLEVLASGYDVVYGTPQREQHGLGRDLASLASKMALRNLVGAEIASQVSAFRAFRRQVANAFRQYEGSFVSVDVLLTWGTNRFAATKVHHEVRKQGVSGYTFRKLVTHSMNMMTGFSTVPLQFASIVGFFFTFVGVGILIYVVTRYFVSGDAVPGFPFLASIVAIFSGAQLFALGIIGEYLARMHFRMMDRPSYAIREVIGIPESKGTL
jgi:undecaprenyl-phosphate 4-deoxy-4-formamido-L-arabinose transferase